MPDAGWQRGCRRLRWAAAAHAAATPGSAFPCTTDPSASHVRRRPGRSLAVLLDVGYHQHFRVSAQLEITQHVDLQGPEAAAELHLLCWRNALIAKHQHVVIQMRAMETREGVCIQRLQEVQADHLGAQRAIERRDPDARALHGRRRIARCLHTRCGSDAGHDVAPRRQREAAYAGDLAHHSSSRVIAANVRFSSCLCVPGICKPGWRATHGARRNFGGAD